jgi:hypothetical protein
MEPALLPRAGTRTNKIHRAERQRFRDIVMDIINGLTFDQWLTECLADAERSGVKHRVQQLPDGVLQLLWVSGLRPSLDHLPDDNEERIAS